MEHNCVIPKTIQPIAIVTAYMPCCNNKPKLNTYNYQLYTKMKEPKKLIHPNQIRTQCWKDLTMYIQNLHSQNMEVIVSLDANSNLNDKKQGLQIHTRLCLV